MSNFIRIANCIFKKGEFILTPQQLFIYCYLYRFRHNYKQEWITNTTVNNIFSTIGCRIDGTRGKKKISILEDLHILREKHYILIDRVNDNVPIKNNEYLSIKISEEHIASKFTQIDYDIFDLFEDRDKYWFYCFIATSGIYGKEVSYSKMSELSGLSISTLRVKVIETMNNVHSKPRIYKFSGSYVVDKEEIEQEPNRYFIRLENDTASIYNLDFYNKLYDDEGNPKIKKQKKNRKLKDSDIVFHPIFSNITVSDLKECVEESNWGSYEEGVGGEKIYYDIQYDDYATYRTCVDYNINLKFTDQCKKSIETMKMPFLRPKYDYCNWEEWENQYIEES
ncbi:hypothetical protein [Paenibacillus odorifer]|uniref:hypothetical protein n=1 Tax=Paenibacillus odorifer TaxID=189426 RepID=UPI00096EA762|nr:hypothetical protein [Paenibacillus odorifer]OME41426.1 hypothetical protein BSK58_14945 [Paenibacillus odorifer]